jgi:glycosyltransferase involved in cell wall biosynthesis
MTRVLVVGHVPLPFENLKKFYAPGARTWHFCEPLIADGHELVMVGMRIPFVYDEDLPEVLKSEERGCTIYSVTPVEAESGGLLHDIAEKFEPECLLGVGAHPSYVAAVSGLELPLWADINGCLLAEAQQKAAVYNDDSFLEHFYRIDHAVVIRADRFSTVALRQKHELVGELAFARRLTSKTSGYDFVADIPNAYPDTPFSEEGAGMLRRRVPDDFLVLWSGGYNTWTDTKTLFEGLSYAMERDSRIKFVSTGGSIDGHDELTYPTLVKMVNSSPHRDRFLLEGWIDRDVARSYYLACNVGINIDAETYEVVYGSRNRIMDWAVAGMPALSTDLCELTEELAKEGLLFTFPAGDPVALGEKLLELARAEEELRETGRRLKRYIGERFSYQATTRALREWVNNPTHAPDWEDRKALFHHEPPPITPESSATAKLKFYLRQEGPLSTVKRAATFAKKKAKKA